WSAIPCRSARRISLGICEAQVRELRKMVVQVSQVLTARFRLWIAYRRGMGNNREHVPHALQHLFLAVSPQLCLDSKTSHCFLNSPVLLGNRSLNYGNKDRHH